MDRLPTRPARSRRTVRWVVAAGGLLVAVALLAAFQPWKLVVDETVDEAVPPAASVAAGPTTTAASPTTTAPPATVAPAAADTATTGADTATTGAPIASATTVAPAAPSPPTAPVPPTEPAATSFVGKAHPTSGTVRLIPQDDGSHVLRIEDLDTENGPDVKVVLSPDPDGYADGAITLATLKGNKGSQNYVVAGDVDLASVRSVVIWCKRFRVDFGVAPLPGV